jgi:pimeloyl-ACP methyl ester carboxylesterase
VAAARDVTGPAPETFEVAVPGGSLAGTVGGQGTAVLVLHGGPGLPWSYLADLVDELRAAYLVAAYQQRGLPPATAGAPYDVTTQTDDVVAVMDALGWRQPVVLGHSWGGHLLLHLLARHPDRVAAALVVDPLGGVGDGGEAAFVAELGARTPPEALARAEELDERSLAGEATPEELAESLRLLWPAYFADPARATAMPDLTASIDAYSQTFESLRAELPALAGRLAGTAVPTLFVHGGGSPIPQSASTDTAAAIGPAASVEVVEGAGHFLWLERPGCVREALDRLVAQLPGPEAR